VQQLQQTAATARWNEDEEDKALSQPTIHMLKNKSTREEGLDRFPSIFPVFLTKKIIKTKCESFPQGDAHQICTSIHAKDELRPHTLVA
jgi:hypothetical protein